MQYKIFKSVLRFKFIILPFVLVQLSCSNSTETPVPDLASFFQVHLREGFNRTHAAISIDNSVVFADTVTTDGVLGVARIVPIQIHQGYHKINVTVSNSVSKDTNFVIIDTLRIGVDYMPMISEIKYVIRRQGFGYH